MVQKNRMAGHAAGLRIRLWDQLEACSRSSLNHHEDQTVDSVVGAGEMPIQ